MNVPSLSPEMTLQQAASTIADHVFEREAYSIVYPNDQLKRWKSTEDFAEPLVLSYFQGNDKIAPTYTFDIGGDLADELVIPAESEGSIALAEDGFIAYFFERFWTVYTNHQHLFCIRSIRVARQEALKRQALFESQKERNLLSWVKKERGIA